MIHLLPTKIYLPQTDYYKCGNPYCGTFIWREGKYNENKRKYCTDWCAKEGRSLSLKTTLRGVQPKQLKKKVDFYPHKSLPLQLIIE